VSLRITFILPHANLSGGTRVVAVYARKLQERGHSVCVISAPRPRPGMLDRMRALLRGNGTGAAGGAEPSHLDGLPIEHRILDRYRPLRDGDIPDGDAVVATWWETAESVAALAPSKGAKLYLIQHDEAVFWPESAIEERARIARTWRLPMHKIVVARWLADLARERGIVDRFTLIPNAVDHETFHAAPRGRQSRPTVGLMYSRTRFKGCDIAIAALGIARRSLPALGVQAFGQEHPGPDLALPEGAAFEFQPAQERIRQIYASCDAWLFSSRSEGFGLPILEAMACRTPVIGTPAGPAPDLLGFGGGVLVPHSDPEAMARAIVDTVSLPDPAWRALSDAASANAARFTWDHSTDLLEASLKAAVRGAAPALA
jgi:glycosyltransferase involved in cell wall biosynthesis